MNNKNFNNMAKTTVFNGVINGEKFDNVAAYNARMNELLTAGVEDISAASSTEIKNIEETTDCAEFLPDPDTCTCDLIEAENDLSFYPYMDEDDVFYLDLLVTGDPVTNQEAYAETQKNLEEHYRYIVSALEDPNTCNCDRKEYLEDVREIIANIKKDIKDTVNAEKIISAKREKLVKEYNESLAKLESEKEILAASMDVCRMFEAFYSDVENETLTAIKNDTRSCTCSEREFKSDPNIVTDCTLKEPERLVDIKDLLDKIFGPNVTWAN